MSSRRYLLPAADSALHSQHSPENTGFWDKVRRQDLILGAVMLILMVLLQSNARADEAPAQGQESYQNLSEVGTGSLVAKSAQGYRGLMRLGSDVSLTVSGMVVQARVTQQFRNQSRDWVEATYVFPLPSDSAVNQMRIKIGERVIEGIIKEKQQAQKLFIKAKQEGKQAGLLEQQRPNLFTTRVANIAPGAAIDVEFSYLQKLHYEGDEFSVRVPLTLTPRYIPGKPLTEAMQHPPVLSANGWAFATDQVPDAPEITPPQIRNPPDQQSHRASLSVDLTPGFDVAAVESPYHDVRVERQSARYRIAPRQNPVVMNRDFELRWRPVPSQAPTAAMFFEEQPLNGAGDGESSAAAEKAKHGLLMLMPPQQAFADVVPPRELLIIIDTSGSMSGASIAQAKAAVLMALDRLRPGDRFNLIEFNSYHRALFPQPQMAEQRWLQQARGFVQSLQANGGTEMYGALEAAFNTPADEGFLRQVVFITDGSVGNERALLELIHTRLGNSRLYTVGIGSAPNEFFMRKAAEFGKGTFAMIGSQQQVQQEMAELFDRIEKPVMTDLQVNFPGGGAELFPQQIPDLYAGQPLVLHARFQDWPDDITVSGKFSGQHWQQNLPVTPPSQTDAGSPGVATLWAREKVQSLEDDSIRQGNRDLHRNGILDLGLDYGIVTRFTSFVAIAKDVVRESKDPLHKQEVPNLMPHGSKQQPPSVGMPQTALGIHYQLLIGCLSLLLAAIVSRMKYVCHFSAIGLPSRLSSVFSGRSS